ncbi:ABC transporter substrate-binding protein [Streptomyces sp. NBC_01754]|uniref:ABC transporter substrate-binding protein n=1 Tax=Streptomyces sp. NBC_01754 TaxID=2975930 RepID=UPI002DD7A0D5|nr:ABC transporter substrate-binding protein [Streptomyces sp. NBC_01754]WSC91088.1 ABC transporter substrate-binding protein [Streptomyces sp. NBC_01754]
MTEQNVWRFTDDRGQLTTAGRRPARVLAYVQAGATLWDHGIRPEGIFGSGHDGATPDRAKTGTLPLESVDYRGAGGELDVDTLLRGDPDLVVAVSYGHGQVYGLDPDTAKHLEERVPLVVVDVGQARTLDRVAERFAELALALGGSRDPGAEQELAAARERLRGVVGAGPERPRVVALSPAGPEQVHIARPMMWPELRVLAELGVGLVAPEAGPGVNWSTDGWDRAAALRPGIVLTDIRSNAVPLDEVEDPAWSAARQGTHVVPWNPEPLCSPQAHARFLLLVADAVEAARGA